MTKGVVQMKYRLRLLAVESVAAAGFAAVLYLCGFLLPESR